MNSCCDTTTTAGLAAPATPGAFQPALDVIETPDSFRIEIEVPGAGKDDVTVDLENRVLTVRARIAAAANDARRYHVREHGPRELVRRIHVGESVDAGRIGAEVKQGILTLRLPKVAAVQPRRIQFV